MFILHFNYRKSLLLAFFIVLTAGQNSAAYAQSADEKQQQRASLLQTLAKNFVKKIAPVYKDEPQDDGQLSYVPDGTTLLFVPQVDDVRYSGDIYAIQQNGQMYLSLVDVIEVLELAIDFDEDTRAGEGWFLREDWRIQIDLEAAKVISREDEFQITADDFYMDGPTVFIRGSTLGQWLDMNFTYDISQQYLNIQSAHPLPAVARYERRNRDDRRRRQENVARLPRMEPESELFDINAANVSAGVQYRKIANGEGTLSNNTSITTEGQLLNHESYAFVSRDSDEGLRTVRARLSRQSENGDLLGPLNARFYELGDVGATDVPLTGSTRQGLGFRLNNNPLINTDFSTTDIEGDNLPGWDVELYRNGVLVETQLVGDDGRYLFQEVPLFAGNNDFELLFYGPQGEVRSETLNVPVTAELLGTQRDTYEVSMQLDDQGIYRRTRSEDEDTGEPDIAARYNKQIGNNSLGFLGLRSRSIDGERRSFASTGITSIIGSTIYDANVAIDDQSNLAAEVRARRNLLGWDISTNAGWSSDEYKISDTSDPSVLRLGARAQRQFIPPLGTRASILASTNYQETAAGNSFLTSELGLSNQFRRFNLSNTLRHEMRTGSEFDEEDRLENSFSVRGNFGKTLVRAGLSYEIKPESEINRYFTQFNYRYDYRKSGDVYLEHDPMRNYSRGRLNLNYTNDYFRLSPFVEYDTDERLYAGVNVNFSLLDHPNQILPEVTSYNVLGKGLVTGFVYYDKNGNSIFDADDEALSDVVLESLNSKRRAPTDESGFAVLKGISVSKPTDIVIDENTLPDSYMISGFEGASVFPVAGQNPKLSFPVHLSGEVDGTLYIEDENGEVTPYANKIIQLLPLDNPRKEIVEAQAMFDGFFLFSKLPPGRYLMVPKESNMQNDANPVPSYIEINYDGTISLENDIHVKAAGGFVPYQVEFRPIDAERYSENYDYRLDVNTNGNSDLSSILGSLLYKVHAAPLLKSLDFIEQHDDGRYTYAGTPNHLHSVCQKLSQKSINCTIRVIVKNEINKS